MSDSKTLTPREVEIAILGWRALNDDFKVSDAISTRTHTLNTETFTMPSSRPPHYTF